MSSRHFVLTNEPLDENLAAQIISQDGAGGVVTFVGRVRDEARGHKVTLLEYEAYPEMVERVFAEIDRLKRIAPIWKKEHTPEGAVWVDDRP